MCHTVTDCQASQQVAGSNRSELQSPIVPLNNLNRPDDCQNGPDDRFLVFFVANITYRSHVSVFAVFLALLAVDKQLKFFTSSHVFSTQGIIIDNCTKYNTLENNEKYRTTIESGR